ncbi:YEATS domain-containing protein 4-like protein [Hyaloraphidium curvatum]|nr:YEATS domain-containing protein 4-like protein [Hyaloraphidium curvatum]
MTVQRVKNCQIVKGIIYGSHAIPLPEKNPENGHTHKWSIFVRGCGHTVTPNGIVASPNPSDDCSNWVKRVQFKLHESFENHVRTVEQYPFEVIESGWGEFEIIMKVYFADPQEKPVTLSHHLKLYNTDDTELRGLREVISEKYDEIVFQEPTDVMKRALELPDPVPTSPMRPHIYTVDYERMELQKYAAALQAAKNEGEQVAQHLTNLQMEFQNLQRVITMQSV